MIVTLREREVQDNFGKVLEIAGLGIDIVVTNDDRPIAIVLTPDRYQELIDREHPEPMTADHLEDVPEGS